MSTLTQRIPNFLLGISQQPDNRKIPGQVRNSLNTFPDYALGLLKRPGGLFKSELQGATSDGTWFSILRDPQEKYVAQYDDNVFRVWNLEDGSPRAVNMGTTTGVPAGCNILDTLTIANAGTGLTNGTFTDLETATTGNGEGLTVNLTIAEGVVTTATINNFGTAAYAAGDTITLSDTATYPNVSLTYTLAQFKTRLNTYNTAVDLVETRLDELNTAQANYANSLDNSVSYKEKVFEVKYYYQPDPAKPLIVDQYLYAGILKDSSGRYIIRNPDAAVVADRLIITSTLPSDVTLGTNFTNEYPVIASEGYEVYQAIYTKTGSTADNLIISDAGSGLTDGTFTDLATETTGSGQNLTVDIVVSGGEVTSATINAVGLNYDDGDTVTLTDSEYSDVSLEYNSDVQEKLDLMTTAQTNYDNAVTARNTALTNYNTEVSNCAISSVPSTAYLSGAGADDIELLTLNDYTFVLNKAKQVAFNTTQSAAKEFHAFAVLKVIGLGHYRIFLDDELAGEVQVTSTNGNDDADEIIQDLVTAINDFTHTNGKQWTATAVGPGIYIEDTVDFDFRVVGGPGEASFFGFKDTVPTVASLPLQCHNGYKVTVVNSEDVNADDMYVEFVTDVGAGGNQPANGPGTWEETNGFEISTTLDPLTMPHVFVRLPDGSFYYGPANGSIQQGITLPSWGTRDVGDEITNPTPSFVGNVIRNIFFYRNRLGFLSNESVILSKAGDYFNFFATTALTVTDDDPIDVSATSIKPVNLRYVKPATLGLVLFSEFQQFLIAGNEDILTPKTVKITELSSYECDPDVEAVALGTTLAFVSKTPLYTRLFELGNITINDPPLLVEPTQYVPELVPESIDSMIASPALSLLSMGTVGDSTLYQFRFTQQGNTRAATTWYKWELTGTLLDQFFDVNTHYAVVANGTDEVYVQSYDLTQASEEGFLTLPTNERTDVCLDLWNINPYRTYDSTNDTTRIFLPYDSVSGGTFSVVVLGGYIGSSLTLTSASVGAVLYPTVAGTAGAFYADVNGDYRGRNLIIGYTYNMEVELPKFFVTQTEGQSAVSDFTSDLIIHRIKVSTGLSGPVKYKVDITGRPEWSNTIEAVQPNVYNLSNVNLSAEAVHTIPLYQRNENLSVTIIGDSPMPVTLLSLNWEGRYNTGFYRRA